MITLNILLGLVEAVLLFGVLGEKDSKRQASITLAFVAVITLIMYANTTYLTYF